MTNHVTLKIVLFLLVHLLGPMVAFKVRHQSTLVRVAALLPLLYAEMFGIPSIWRDKMRKDHGPALI